jgi:RimJ/RimL family protein N-acetyltransferase
MAAVELQPFAREDFSRLLGWIRSPEFLLQWAGPIFRFPLDEGQLEEYLKKARGEAAPRRIFKAAETGTGETVGHIELDAIDRRNRSARVARVLIGEPWRGKGLGEQMVRRIVEIGFDQMKLHRIDLVAFDFNRKAIACYERAGFVREGRIRDARRMGNGYWSLIQMSILEDEWRDSAG